MVSSETTEYLVEAIVGHRGSLREGDREVLVKWVGYEEPDWRKPETLKNPNLVS